MDCEATAIAACNWLPYKYEPRSWIVFYRSPLSNIIQDQLSVVLRLVMGMPTAPVALAFCSAIQRAVSMEPSTPFTDVGVVDALFRLLQSVWPDDEATHVFSALFAVFNAERKVAPQYFLDVGGVDVLAALLRSPVPDRLRIQSQTLLTACLKYASPAARFDASPFLTVLDGDEAFAVLSTLTLMQCLCSNPSRNLDDGFLVQTVRSVCRLLAHSNRLDVHYEAVTVLAAIARNFSDGTRLVLDSDGLSLILSSLQRFSGGRLVAVCCEVLACLVAADPSLLPRVKSGLSPSTLQAFFVSVQAPDVET